MKILSIYQSSMNNICMNVLVLLSISWRFVHVSPATIKAPSISFIKIIFFIVQELSEEELFGSEISTTREAIAILLLSSFDQLRASNIILNFIFRKSFKIIFGC